jgi:hypothetical protein
MIFAPAMFPPILARARRTLLSQSGSTRAKDLCESCARE